MPGKVFIIHRYGGSPDSDWYSWLRMMMEQRGFAVTVPAMPQMTDMYSKPWVDALKTYAKSFDADTYFVGHDFGCFAILKYIDSIITGLRVGGALFVAPYMISERLNYAGIKAKIGKMTAIFAKDDPLVALSDSAIFSQDLGANVVVMPLKTHFLAADGYAELHAGLNELLKITGATPMAGAPGGTVSGPGEI